MFLQKPAKSLFLVGYSTANRLLSTGGGKGGALKATLPVMRAGTQEWGIRDKPRLSLPAGEGPGRRVQRTAKGGREGLTSNP